MSRLVRGAVQLGLVVAILAIAALGAKAMVDSRVEPEVAPPVVEPPLVEVLVAQTERVQLRVESLGELRPQRDADLSSQVAGRVEWVSPRLIAGGRVSGGEELVRLDTRDLEVVRVRAAAAVAQAEAALQQQEAEAQRAVEDWERLGRGGEPPPLVRREPQLAKARADLDAARADRSRADLDVERAVLRAPFDGGVRSVAVGEGQFVSPGIRLGVLFRTDPMELRLSLTERELTRLDLDGLLRGEAVGPEVTFTTRFAGREARWSGRVVRLEGEVDPVSRLARVVAELSPEASVGSGEQASSVPLLAGLFVDAAVAGRVLERAIVLPRRALVRPGVVMVAEAEGRLSLRDVRIVESRGDRVVIDDGLMDGDWVVTSPVEAPVDGMAVRVVPPEGGAEGGPDGAPQGTYGDGSSR